MNTPVDATGLTELQLELLDVLWSRREATVNQVREAMSDRRDLAPTTVATLLSRLEKKGVVTHRVDGRQYVYRALVSKAHVTQSMVAALTDRLFQGDVTQLVNHLLTETEITSGDLERVRALIAKRSQSNQEGT